MVVRLRLTSSPPADAPDVAGGNRGIKSPVAPHFFSSGTKGALRSYCSAHIARDSPSLVVPLLLRVAFALRNLWDGSQRSGSFVAQKMRFIRTPLLLERPGRQARKGT